MSEFASADERAWRVVEAALGGKLPSGARVSEVALWGVRVVLVYRLDEAEHRRRAASNAEPLNDLWLLDTLLKLPVGRPVPLAMLEGRDRRRLSKGWPAGAVEQRADMVERAATLPLWVDLAVVRSETASLEALHVMPFGAYAPQAIWLDCLPAGSEQLLEEAAHFSTGVVHWQGAGEPQVLVPVQPLADVAGTAAGWRFTEHAYEQASGRVGGPGEVSPLRPPTA
ncbi:hypothetical protein OG760_03650 [Streptomyces sp. NBC_00963]|uniref:hypothetical protein n=1 Tax=Streptomyces sp. NBC_00963 TaxID=2903697 RepID=UPI003868D5FE|nr:hypothetical protein OG760_03650 [Streptomyces sp. NBC_00963]